MVTENCVPVTGVFLCVVSVCGNAPLTIMVALPKKALNEVCYGKKAAEGRVGVLRWRQEKYAKYVLYVVFCTVGTPGRTMKSGRQMFWMKQFSLSHSACMSTFFRVPGC